MNDFQKTLEAKSDQVNAADLTGGPMTITITRIKINTREEQPVSIFFAGSEKAYKPCKGMRRMIAAMWGDLDESCIGRSITIYRDPDVSFGGAITGGTRISHLSHIDRDRKMVIPISRGKVKEYTVRPIATQPDAPVEPENALDLCRAAARNGAEAFRAWWTSDEGKSCRVTANRNIDDLKRIAAEADAARKPAATAGDDEPPM